MTFIKRTIRPYIYLSLFVLTTTLIAFFSLSPAEQSSEHSGIFVDAFAWLFALFGYTPTPDVLGLLDTIVRKLIGHFGLFFIDGVFAYLTFVSFVKAKKSWIPLVISLSVTLVFSFTSELLQLFASGRAMMLTDVIFNYAGAYTGIMLVYMLMNKKKAKEQTT